MTAPTSLELLTEFEAAKVSAKALFRRAAKNIPSAVAVTRQAIREDLGDSLYNEAYTKNLFSASGCDLQMRT